MNIEAPVSVARQMPELNAYDYDFSIVGIGASAGGIKALMQFFAELPADSGMAYVVIVHLSEEHESNLAAILQQHAKMPVTQVTETVKVEPNHIYVIPPTQHLAMVDGMIKLTEPEYIRGHRVPIDLFFRTLADIYGRQAFCVILSGTGTDGTLGLKRIKEHGGIAFAQDPEDAEYDGMPRSAIGTGLVDFVLPAAEIPERLVALQQFAETLQLHGVEQAPKIESEAAGTSRPPPDSSAKPGVDRDVLREVLTLLRVRTGHDFFNYRRPTLLRRLARRMQVQEITGLPAYLNLLREQPEEVRALLRDLLITVTNFFRDKEAFAALERDVVPRLFAGKGAGDTVRVWVCGCATGEEAYSLGILLCEYAAQLTQPPTIQIFASDINEDAIHFARECCYDESIVADVSTERLRQFFTKEGNSYRLKKAIRELVLFAPHNVLRDPPFSRQDLITCRNLLIYLNRETQNRVLELFHFSLRRDGFLFLGAAETAENQRELFATVDKKQRIYKCSATQAAHQQLPKMPIAGKWEVRIPEALGASGAPQKFLGTLHHLLVERYAPPSVLINEEYDIVHASENAARFLRFASGEPSRNLLKVAHPALQLDLRAALFAARQENRESRSSNVCIQLDGVERSVNLIVRPAEFDDAQGFFLILFEENAEPFEAPPVTSTVHEALAGDKALEAIVRRLEEDLQQARDQLRATVEQSETSTEELKAANEELQAINEELRSASEEVETSKEELQSVNEELTTVNHELRDKIETVNRVNSDMQNLMDATDIATLFLDRALRIKRYTPRLLELFNIIPSDMGRPLEHLTHKLDYNFICEDAAEVLQTLQVKEREVRGGQYDSRYLVRLAPYRTVDDKIEGVVLSFQDITELRRAAEGAEERFRALISQATAGIVQTDVTGCFNLVNDKYCEIVGYAREELLRMRIQDITSEEDLPRHLELFERLLTTGAPFVIEKRYRSKNGSLVWVSNSVSAIRDADGKIKNVLAFLIDITERKQREEELRASEEFNRKVLESSPDCVKILDQSGRLQFMNVNGLFLMEIDDFARFKNEFWSDLWDQKTQPLIKESVARAMRGETTQFQAFCATVKGTPKWWDVILSPITNADGQPTRLIAVSRDITQAKYVEEALHASEHALREADRRKDEFLATLAHELRNPLAAISPAIAVLQHSMGEQGKLPLQVMERQLKQIVRLVDDLLDVGRISQGKIKLQLEPVALTAVVETMLETVQPLAAATQHKLTVTLPPEPLYLQADPLRLAQVLLNLLTNAIRYTDPGGQITLTAARAGEQAVVRVKDKGKGIAPEMLPHIFELFTQGDQTNQGGLGIGLSLAQKLTELHGGAIEAHSAGLGQGCEFIVRLPLAPAPEAEPAAPTAEPQPLTAHPATHRILVVDDNADSAEMLEMMLSIDGHEVRLAYDGETGLQMALEFQPSLIFLDLGLPDMHGAEVAERLRPQLPHTLLVALSGWGQDADRQRTLTAGFDHHLVKPLNFDQLPALLNAASLRQPGE